MVIAIFDSYDRKEVLCRQYTAASEAWANIMSAYMCGGEALEYVKEYLPNSYQAMLNILTRATRSLPPQLIAISRRGMNCRPYCSVSYVAMI